MIQKTEAILLKRQDLRETSLLLSFYTKGFGKITGVMKGVRGQRGQYSYSPQLFSLNEVVFYDRKTRDIFTISQCELKEFFPEIREDLEKTSYAVYFIELINNLLPLCEKNERMFELLENGLRFLCGEASEKRVARIFEIKLLEILGLMPQLNNCVSCGARIGDKARFSLKNGGVVCGNCFANQRDAVPVAAGAINFMGHINRSDWPMVLRIKVSREVGRQVEDLLRRFMDYHLHFRPKTLEFMRKTQMITDRNADEHR